MDEDRARELEEKYQGYKVNDNEGRKIGKVDDLFIDENDREEYIGVNIGFLGSKSILIPLELMTTDHEAGIVVVSSSKERVKDAPSFDSDEDITPEYETRIRQHFGLDPAGASQEAGPREEAAEGTGSERAGPSSGMEEGRDTGSESGREPDPGHTAPGSERLESPEGEGASTSSGEDEEQPTSGRVRVVRRSSDEGTSSEGASGEARSGGARVRHRPGEERG